MLRLVRAAAVRGVTAFNGDGVRCRAEQSRGIRQAVVEAVRDVRRNCPCQATLARAKRSDNEPVPQDVDRAATDIAESN